jgi:pimeloyl-ACP methyl ester carboxylesterase
MSTSAAEAIEESIAANGLRFRALRWGTPGAPPLVMLHAMGRTADDWRGVAPSLAGAYDIFAFDQRGHGATSHAREYSFELMRDDLRAVADALGLGRFTLVGHSMGGTVAYLFAEEWPERVEKLVAVDTPPPWGGTPFPEPPPEPPEPVGHDWALMAPIMRQLSHPDPAWWGRLGEITAPTLIIGGGAASFVPQDLLADAARRIPGAKLVTIEGGGHVPYATRLPEFLAALHAFLDG